MLNPPSDATVYGNRGAGQTATRWTSQTTNLRLRSSPATASAPKTNQPASGATACGDTEVDQTSSRRVSETTKGISQTEHLKLISSPSIASAPKTDQPASASGAIVCELDKTSSKWASPATPWDSQTKTLSKWASQSDIQILFTPLDPQLSGATARGTTDVEQIVWASQTKTPTRWASLTELTSSPIDPTTSQPSGATVYSNTDVDQTPEGWAPQTENLKLVELARNCDEWKSIEKRFKSTLTTATILKISRIQNIWLWEKYTNQKKLLHRKNKGKVNEMELFHGTRENDPKLIYNGQDGFDMRMSNKGLWGQANYFAVDSSYSDQYAFVSGGTKEMFLVKVLTGDSCECNYNDSLRLPPQKPVKQALQKTTTVGDMRPRLKSLKFQVQRYDTVTGITKGCRVYMTYDNEKSYPAYLVQYNK